jgi:hypothetical protein
MAFNKRFISKRDSAFYLNRSYQIEFDRIFSGNIIDAGYATTIRTINDPVYDGENAAVIFTNNDILIDGGNA